MDSGGKDVEMVIVGYLVLEESMGALMAAVRWIACLGWSQLTAACGVVNFRENHGVKHEGDDM